jgi:hypothetical protein
MAVCLADVAEEVAAALPLAQTGYTQWIRLTYATPDEIAEM